MKTQSESKSSFIRIRPSTRQRLDRIRKQAGWNIMEAADRATKALAEKMREPEVATHEQSNHEPSAA